MGIFSRRAQDGDPFELGMSLWRQGRGAEAAKAFKDAVRADRRSVDAQFFLGASLAEAGDAKAAVAPLAKCVELAPAHADGHNTLAMVLGRLGRTRESEVHLAHAAYLGHPQASETLRELGLGHCRRCGDPVEREAPVEALVRYHGPRVGMECEKCPTVFCVRCVLGNGASGVAPRCLECGTTLRALRTTSPL
ncbi:tetratricopeptide repeat protein [Amycolatopsis rhabdoformis]|uniref:Tetratricopeptide repeat protein n=1 Tax=Amycolatopsis rhabdoformis TaxID=1448059 RepID=A0ABZ1I4L8_9PSEU|nr:tetratricopeptide repeat protein [Amycolatopsis rhabdoformis]WSE28727.1 tetratricopeptide repeat protein [Amycolatopsis rhabdoformis]